MILKQYPTMPRKRNKENSGTPTGWQWYHGAWRYQVPRGQEKQWDGQKKFTLGKNLNEAYSTWSKRLGNTQRVATVGDLLQRYYREVSRDKPPQSLKSDTRSYKELTKAFHDVRIEDLTPQDIYKYIDKRSAKIAARREKSMLSHAYTKAVEWGCIAKHPFKGEVRLKGEKARTRYIDDTEISQIMAMKPRRKKDIISVIQAYINFKNITALRQGDILKLKVTAFTDEGIPTPIGKAQNKNKHVVITWTPALREAVEVAKAARPVHISPYLFCNRRGQSYWNEEKGSASGWQTIWQRFKLRVEQETGIPRDSYTEHDLRAKSGSDAETKERASELLTHDSVATTVRAYRRKPERIRPLK